MRINCGVRIGEACVAESDHGFWVGDRVAGRLELRRDAAGRAHRRRPAVAVCRSRGLSLRQRRKAASNHQTGYRKDCERSSRSAACGFSKGKVANGDFGFVIPGG